MAKWHQRLLFGLVFCFHTISVHATEIKDGVSHPGS